MTDLFCALCQSGIAAAEATSSCPSCGAVYHRDCHEENGGCGNYGCPSVPQDAQQAASVVAPSVWGAERKDCPACSARIRAAAVRCRHCGAMFETRDPMTIAEYQDAKHKKTHLQRLGTMAVMVLVGGVIPCTAPLILLIAPLIYWPQRRLVSDLSPMYRLFLYLGLSLSAVWVLIIVCVLSFSGRGTA